MIDYLDTSNLKEDWNRSGFVILKDILNPSDTISYLSKVKKISSLDNKSYEEVVNGTKNYYLNINQPLVSDKDFWPLFTNKKLLNYIKNIIDSDISFGEGDGIFFHRSATSLHRDSFMDCNNFIGPDFDPTLELLHILNNK